MKQGPITASDFGIDPDDHKAQTIADAESTLHKTPAEKLQLLREMLNWVEEAWDAVALTVEERRLRRDSSDFLEPLPARWWERIPPAERDRP